MTGSMTQCLIVSSYVHVHVFLNLCVCLDQANGVDEVDHISRRLSELQGELFLSLKEDIAEWIIKTLG